MEKKLTCIICPMGCPLEITLPENYNPQNPGACDIEAFVVKGNTCPRGVVYAKKELTYPERTLTCTVAVVGGNRPLVTAKTKGEVPKDKLLDCMEAVRRIVIKAPVAAGQVIVKDLLHTGIDLVACEKVEIK